jgi:hypothetical protein
MGNVQRRFRLPVFAFRDHSISPFDLACRLDESLPLGVPHSLVGVDIFWGKHKPSRHAQRGGESEKTDMEGPVQNICSSSSSSSSSCAPITAEGKEAGANANGRSNLCIEQMAMAASTPSSMDIYSALEYGVFDNAFKVSG